MQEIKGSHLEDIDEIINSILLMIFKNENLCKLIKYQEEDALSQPTFDGEELMNKQIYKTCKVPDAITKDNTLLNIYFVKANSNRTNYAYDDIYIGIDVICKQQNWILEDGSVRPYMIINMIDKMLNGTLNFDTTYARVSREACSLVRYSDSFQGYYLIYKLACQSGLM